jgi:hypothetical protein
MYDVPSVAALNSESANQILLSTVPASYTGTLPLTGIFRN